MQRLASTRSQVCELHKGQARHPNATKVRAAMSTTKEPKDFRQDLAQMIVLVGILIENSY